MSDQNLFSLKGKLALVTGGEGNLGPCWIEALEKSGAKVVSLDLPQKQKKFRNFIGCDITDTKELAKIHIKINKEYGPVSILVNNAGIDVTPGASVENIKKIWEINVQGLVNCINEFMPDMKKLKRASIINIGSLYLERSPDEKLYSHMNFDKPWAYGASKAAVDAVTRHYATRLAKYGIRVNTLSPGGVFNNQDKEFVRKYSEKVPLGRMADKKQDLAGPLVFLASDASSYVTGINLQVNGGYTAW